MEDGATEPPWRYRAGETGLDTKRAGWSQGDAMGWKRETWRQKECGTTGSSGAERGI